MDCHGDARSKPRGNARGNEMGNASNFIFSSSFYYFSTPNNSTLAGRSVGLQSGPQSMRQNELGIHIGPVKMSPAFSGTIAD